MTHSRGPWGYGGFDPFFERGMDPERMFRRHGGLRFYVLWLLSRKPMNGSEIMGEIQKQTIGFWKPSPGSIYPLLSSMENDGLALKGEDGRYSLTDKGRETIGIPGSGAGASEGSKKDIDRVMTDLESYATYLSELEFNISDFSARLDSVIETLQKLKKKAE